jgi:SAM-dependent methyltransferase
MTQSAIDSKAKPHSKYDEIRARFRWRIKRGMGIMFDAVHGADTGPVVTADDLEIVSANSDKGIAYDPCPWRTLRQSLDHISLRPDGFTFVDIGCGKGKVLLSASVLPFTRIVGVEFSRYLCRIAENNVASARFLKRKCFTIEVLCLDAVQYNIPDERTIFFFANPFSYEIMNTVLENIVNSYLKVPRQIFLIFYAVSSIARKISEFLALHTCGQSIDRISTTLGPRSLYIFELPGDVLGSAIEPVKAEDPSQHLGAFGDHRTADHKEGSAIHDRATRRQEDQPD